MATHATAGAIDPIAGNPGPILELEDDDWEILVNSGGSISTPGADTSIDVGDFFVGILRISQINSPPGGSTPIHDYDEAGGETITAIFAIKVASKVANGSFFDYGVTSLSDAEWASVGLDAAGYSRSNTLGQTIAIVYDVSVNCSLASVAGQDASAAEYIASRGGTKLWEFGLVTASNFWTVTGATGSIPTSGSAAAGSFNAGLDITHDYGGTPGLAKLANSVLFPLAPGSSHLLISGGVKGGRDNTDFDLISDTDLLIRTPEPGSVTLFGLGALGLLGARIRRRRAA